MSNKLIISFLNQQLTFPFSNDEAIVDDSLSAFGVDVDKMVSISSVVA